MSIFAQQFGYGDAYKPSGLDTGTPMVGATLRRPRPKRAPEKDPVRQPANASQGANFEGGAASAAGLAAGAAAAGEASASASANASMARQGTLNKTASLERQQEHQDAASTPSVGYGGGNFNMPVQKTSGANPQPHFNPQFGPQPQVQTQQSPGVLGSIGHFIGDVGHDINSVATNPVVSRILHFGAIPGVPQPGVANVLQGNVIGKAPSAPAGEITSGGPRTIQGHVMTPEEMGGGAAHKAISPYDYNSEFNSITNQQQFGSGSTSTFDDIVAGLEDLVPR